MDAENLREMLKAQKPKPTPKDRQTGLSKEYVEGLTKAQKARQLFQIRKSMKTLKETGKVVQRPGERTSTAKSPHTKKFREKYGFPITDLKRVKAEFPGTDIDKILAKGIAAYASGARPGISINAWKFARLASVLTGGDALKVDKDLVGDADLRKITA